VLLDEVGRGTSTFDASASPGRRGIPPRGRSAARTLFATHYHSSRNALLFPRIKNFTSKSRNGTTASFPAENRRRQLRPFLRDTGRALAGVPKQVILRPRKYCRTWKYGTHARHKPVLAAPRRPDRPCKGRTGRPVRRRSVKPHGFHEREIIQQLQNLDLQMHALDALISWRN